MKLSHSNYLQLAFVTNHRLQLRTPGVASSIRNVKTLLASKGLKMTQLSVVTSRLARLGSFSPFDLEIFIEGKMWIFSQIVKISILAKDWIFFALAGVKKPKCF